VTVTLTAVVVDISGNPEGLRPWTFSTPTRGNSGDIVAGSSVSVRPVDGVLTVKLLPGPATVEFEGKSFDITVPDSACVPRLDSDYLTTGTSKFADRRC